MRNKKLSESIRGKTETGGKRRIRCEELEMEVKSLQIEQTREA